MEREVEVEITQTLKCCFFVSTVVSATVGNWTVSAARETHVSELEKMPERINEERIIARNAFKTALKEIVETLEKLKRSGVEYATGDALNSIAEKILAKHGLIQENTWWGSSREFALEREIDDLKEILEALES